MILSFEREVLKEYTAKQHNFFFSDPYVLDLKNYKTAFDLAIDILEYCFDEVSIPRYKKENKSYINHLYSDHFVM